jgi:uncharacterized protein (TIGR03083 family)
MDVQEMIVAERGDLAAVLGALTEQQWDAPTLCAGWRVREVVAHTTMPFRYSTGKFLLEMARSGMRFNAMSDRCARRDAAALSSADLVNALAGNVHHPWKPPGGGFVGALSHEVIHGLDYTVALGLDRRVPADRLRIVLDSASGTTARRHFGVDLDGVQLRADDLDWSLGSGAPLTGAAQDLLLVLCGRRLPAGRLAGAVHQLTRGKRSVAG